MDTRNFIHKVNIELYLLIRTTLMKYYFETKDFYTCTVEDLQRTFKKASMLGDLFLLNPDIGVKVSRKVQMYGCPTRRMPEPVNGKKPSYHWRIAAATTTHSMFILKRSYYGFRIEALIENLFPKYILYII